MNKILSICIPTRNRLHTLNANIEYLIKTIKLLNLQDQIDILISDNSIDKISKKIIKPKEKFYRYLHFNDKGADDNIYNLIKFANTEYMWICQDHTKIDKNALKKIFNLLNNNKKIDFIFVSTKDNYTAEEIVINNPIYFAFKNIYLNTNIIKVKDFYSNYKILFNRYKGSQLVFHFSIIQFLFNKKNPNIKYILNRCSTYKFFNTQNEHYKMTWSHELDTYLNILNGSSKFYNEFILKNNHYKIDILKIVKKFDNSIPTLYRIRKLIGFKNNYYQKNNDFINHPTFYYFEKLLLKIIFDPNKRFIKNFLFSIYLVEIYYLIYKIVKKLS